MQQHHQIPSADSGQSPDYGMLQEIVDALFKSGSTVSKRDVLTMAEIRDPSDEVLEIVSAIPSGSYRRVALVDQMNSAIAAHGWGSYLGTVE